MVPPRWNNFRMRPINARRRRLRSMGVEARTAMRKIDDLLQNIMEIVSETNLRRFLRLCHQCIAIEPTTPVHEYLDTRRNNASPRMLTLIDRVREVFDLCHAVDVQKMILRNIARNVGGEDDDDGDSIH